MKAWIILCCVALSMLNARAATILWNKYSVNNEENILTDTDGAFVFAYYLGTTRGGAINTVNGVQFTNKTADNVKDDPISGLGIKMLPSGDTGVGGFNNGPPGYVSTGTSLTGNYKTLLGGGLAHAGGTSTVYKTYEFTLTGLTRDMEYAVQFWSYDERTSTSRTTIVGNGVSDEATGALSGEGSIQSSPRQDYYIGTFVADAESQTFYVRGNQYLPINAIQLRELGMIPEPSSLLLLSVCVMGMVSRRKR